MPREPFPTFDVLVAGGGNAALCAALTAAERGAKVLVIECAPREFRGGNSRHTRNMRRMSHAYPAREYLGELERVTGGQMDRELASIAVNGSGVAENWMTQHGVRFQPALEGTLQLDRTNAFFLGGGKGLLNSYYARAESLGVRVLYDAEVTGLQFSNGAFESASVRLDGETVEIRARTLVAASGGFESNLEWLKQAWGDGAENFLIRGTPYNTGTVLRLLLDAGAEEVGDATQCHAVAIDARAPKFDGGIVTRLDSIPLGIVVNKHAERFYDEGEDLWPKRYAIWGRLVAQQPDQIAYSIVDAKAAGMFMPSVFPPITADSIEALAAALGLNAAALRATIDRFNAAVVAGPFDAASLDGCHTNGLTPPKSHWARTIDMPPYLAYPLRPGITFTYLGVKVTGAAQVVMPASNVFAAGEIMAGNILGQGYLAGFGMTIGTVFGRIAGEEAARAAH